MYNFRNLISQGIRNFSTSTKTKVYELKTYNVLPNNIPAFLELLKDNNGKSSNRLGTWTTEMGSSNQVISLVEHESLDDRQVNEWNSKFQSKVGELVEKQDSLILREFPWAPFKKISTQQADENKVWELRTYQSKPGKLGQWAVDFTNGFTERKKISEPVGVFFSEFGALNTIVHLWPYKSFEDRFRIRDLALKNPVWVETVAKTTANLASMESKTIVPVKL
ncbi:hypothetical protein RB653_008750 [Dictyostelium firmibasis]|uniref:NIPSNAP domain-containing protein n=1 Tax=Dictyostelium firmibasis TaxID=79012 RepID=A0AAN7U0N4_9MYCE